MDHTASFRMGMFCLSSELPDSPEAQAILIENLEEVSLFDID